jgi:hypothetical protein
MKDKTEKPTPDEVINHMKINRPDMFARVFIDESIGLSPECDVITLPIAELKQHLTNRPDCIIATDLD